MSRLTTDRRRAERHRADVAASCRRLHLRFTDGHWPVGDD